MTTQTLETTASDGESRPPAVVRALRAFRHWRKGRPFPSGLLITLSGLEIWAAPYSSIGVMIHEGIAGFSAVFVGTLLIVFGLTVWFAPAYRAFAGIASILLGLIALPTINIGGFVIGTLLALIGGGLAVAWTPRPGWEAPNWGQRRAARRAVAEAPGAEASEAVVPAQGTAEPALHEADGGESEEAAAAPLPETFEDAEAELIHRRTEGEDGSAESQD
jgi:hypothetical protein